MTPEEFMRELSIFLGAMGKKLPEVLRDPIRFSGEHKFVLWLESAIKLGIITKDGDRFEVHASAIEKAIDTVKKVFEDWISD